MPWLLPMSVYPRVGGGTESVTDSIHAVCGLSPRGRGNLSTMVVAATRAGSIPAWAGEPSPTFTAP